MDYETIKLDRDGALLTVRLNRPEKRNALTRAMLKEIRQAFRDLHGERRVRAVILTGAGSAFCAGMDLADHSSRYDLHLRRLRRRMRAAATRRRRTL